MLERPTGGKIVLDGEDICAPGYDVAKARRKMGMVFQSFNLCVPLQITVEYSEKDDSTEITASYGGEQFDPAKSGDGFSYQVLRSTVKSLTYHYDPVAEQTNTVKVLMIRKFTPPC